MELRRGKLAGDTNSLESLGYQLIFVKHFIVKGGL